MTTIERINLPKPDTHCFDDDTNSDVWSYSPELVREIVLAHIDALTAEISASDIAIAEYRQQCLDNAAEIARLRAESEERLQNCAALVAENERLRKDAERMREALTFYAQGEHFHFDRAAWDTVSGEPQNYWCDEEGTATVEDGTIAKLAIDAAMKGTP